MTRKIKRKLMFIIAGTLIFIPAIILSKSVNGLPGLILFVAAYILLGGDVLKQAFINIFHGSVFDENFLMMIATFGAFACKEYTEAVAVMLFYQIGEVFQSIAVNNSRKAIKSLLDIRPDFARVKRNDTEEEVDPSEVEIGEIIVIRPGERVPLDGIIVDGASSLDTAALTGESIPKDVTVDDDIFSGCINLSGVISVKVSKGFEESTVSRILNLVEESQNKKAKSEQFITVFARVYTPIIVGLAFLLIILGSVITKDWSTWVYRGMTFLLISCPCALVISIPLSFFGGIGGAGKRGILIKGGNFMDVLDKVDTLILDKTGTITKGNFAIGKIVGSNGFSEDDLLYYAAYAEANSSHPIARSIVEKYAKEIVLDKISDVTELAGKGIIAQIDGHRVAVGNRRLTDENLSFKPSFDIDEFTSDNPEGTKILLCVDGSFAGYIQIVDEIKPEAKSTFEALGKMGVKDIIMLTGDNKSTASSVSKKVGITSFFAELSPLDKVTALEKILAEKKNGKVCFIGDGINDAPVLTRADIGIAMGGMGSDAAIEASDIVIMTDELSKIAEAKKIARKTLKIVKENIVFALGVKVLVLVLAAFGIATMWSAVFADVGVAFLAIMNATRCLRAGETR